MTIRTAVLGFGLSGRIFHAPFIAANPAFELAAVVTGNSGRRDQAKAEYPEVEVLDSVHLVFDRADDFDLVVIGTPSGTHSDLAGRALEVGLHVVVDKPFAVTSEDGRALVTKAEQVGKVLTVFQNRRWDGDFLTLKKLIDAGELGRSAASSPGSRGGCRSRAPLPPAAQPGRPPVPTARAAASSTTSAPTSSTRPCSSSAPSPTSTPR